MLLQLVPPSDVLYKLGPSEKYITDGLDLETAIERNSIRGRSVGKNVITNIT